MGAKPGSMVASDCVRLWLWESVLLLAIQQQELVLLLMKSTPQFT
jgi:hypothetical protein